ncbi:flagellar biosynthetic protein FliO [Bremerella sp. JC817]|uniref:FliO/MopB family protein n=1 Tax=Bremerella sp. JC817 TaxID=3231756 RepID=UPI0034596CEE
MRNGILGGCLALLVSLTWSNIVVGNDYAGSQVPPNRPLQIREQQQQMPAEFPPLAQALHVEQLPPEQAGHAQPVVAELPQAGEPLPLPKRNDTPAESMSLPSFNFKGNQTASIAASLFVVVGLFLVFAWVGKKNMKPGSTRLSKEILQVLGKSQLSGKQQLELVRVGQKLLLLCVTSSSVETLTEITDPTEVERLLTIIRQDSPGSMTATFQEVLTQMGHKPTRGFLEA